MATERQLTALTLDALSLIALLKLTVKTASKTATVTIAMRVQLGLTMSRPYPFPEHRIGLEPILPRYDGGVQPGTPAVRSGGRGRTYNLQIQSLLRRQLRHSRVHLVGIEPTTFGLRDRCSSQLSYRCVHPVGNDPTRFRVKAGCSAI